MAENIVNDLKRLKEVLASQETAAICDAAIEEIVSLRREVAELAMELLALHGQLDNPDAYRLPEDNPLDKSRDTRGAT